MSTLWPHSGRFVDGTFEKRERLDRRSIRAARAVSNRGDLVKTPLKSKRRKIGSARFEVNMDVEFLGLTPEGVEVEGIGVVRNLSMRGALIETYALVTTDDQLTLFLTLPHQPELLEVPAVAVRWVVRRHQLGVEFLKLERQTSLQLMRYLSGIYNAAWAQRKAV
jgi:PilZ domain-containing protein